MNKVKLMIRRVNLPLIVISLLAVGGCSTLKEAAKCIIGVSTKAVEDTRKNAVALNINSEYKKCYDQVKKNLVDKGSYIYYDNQYRGLLAIYVSKEDTTPVGVFFTKVDSENTKIEVSSPSTYAKEFIAERIYKGSLGNPIDEKVK